MGKGVSRVSVLVQRLFFRVVPVLDFEVMASTMHETYLPESSAYLDLS